MAREFGEERADAMIEQARASQGGSTDDSRRRPARRSLPERIFSSIIVFAFAAAAGAILAIWLPRASLAAQEGWRRVFPAVMFDISPSNSAYGSAAMSKTLGWFVFFVAGWYLERLMAVL
ncbi:MAG: hypothetical protein AAFU73_03380 [Planctomycetota bacterium]